MDVATGTMASVVTIPERITGESYSPPIFIISEKIFPENSSGATTLIFNRGSSIFVSVIVRVFMNAMGVHTKKSRG